MGEVHISNLTHVDWCGAIESVVMHLFVCPYVCKLHGKECAFVKLQCILDIFILLF